MKEDDRMLKVSADTCSLSPSVSILRSKRQIEEIQSEIEEFNLNKNYSVSGAKKWQITSAVSIDWKNFEETERMRNQLMAKDIQKNDNTIFSYLIQQWKEDKPYKVIYKWIRTPKSVKLSRTSKKFLLLEQQHIYRGQMRDYHKYGEGVYLILKKFMDNSQKITKINGFWKHDILEHGTMIDENGQQQLVYNNLIKLNEKSNKKATAFIDKNLAIEELKKHSNRTISRIGTSKISSFHSIEIAKP